jgi:hypothetical protein
MTFLFLTLVLFTLVFFVFRRNTIEGFLTVNSPPLTYPDFKNLTNNLFFTNEVLNLSALGTTPKANLNSDVDIQKNQTEFIVNTLISDLNNNWSALEIMNVEKLSILSPSSSNIDLDLFLLHNEKNIPLHILVNLDFDYVSGSVIYKKITLFTKTPTMKNFKKYDPLFNKHFEIKNILGLFTPFKTSSRFLISKKEIETHEINKQKQKNQKKFCLNKPHLNSMKSCVNDSGVWDKPVINDIECPFFRSNTHYPNKRGGNKGGFCELPSGLKLKGFRYIDPSPVPPLCYNCKTDKIDNGTLGYCCDKQLDNVIDYPDLRKYPDYKFPGDEIERSHYKNILGQKNLSHR